VISPTRAFYARLGTPFCWLADPDPDKPALTVFELTDGDCKEIAQVTGEQAWTAGQPFPVRVVPADLIRGLRP
jgi:hypothetical protein